MDLLSGTHQQVQQMTAPIDVKRIPVTGHVDDLQVYQGKTVLVNEYPLIFRLHKYSGGQMLLWVGEESKFTSISSDVSIPSNLNLAIGPTSTSILTDQTSHCDLSDVSLASKLSTKYNAGKPFYMSLNTPGIPSYQLSHLTIALNQAIKQFMSQVHESWKDIIDWKNG